MEHHSHHHHHNHHNSHHKAETTTAAHHHHHHHPHHDDHDMTTTSSTGSLQTDKHHHHYHHHHMNAMPTEGDIHINEATTLSSFNSVHDNADIDHHLHNPHKHMHHTPGDLDTGGHHHGQSDLDTEGHGFSGHIDHSMHDGMAMSEDHHTMMAHPKPVFRWVTDVHVLFEQWTTDTVAEVVMAMLAAAFLAALYEWLRYWLSSWDNDHAKRTQVNALPGLKRMLVRSLRSVLHSLNALVGYLQMLFGMTYDLRIFVAIILGSGIGFFVLGPYFRGIAQARQKKRKLRARQDVDTEEEECKTYLVKEFSAKEPGHCLNEGSEASSVVTERARERLLRKDGASAFGEPEDKRIEIAHMHTADVSSCCETRQADYVDRESVV